MRSPVSLFLVLSLVLLAACNRSSPTEPSFEGTATLSGVVSYAETGAPVAGARVTAFMTVVKGTPNSGEAVTDATGRYSLSVPGGTYIVSVFAPGATTHSFIPTIVIGGSSFSNFEISANGCVTLSGRVVDANTHAGIPGATIDFLGRHVVTGEDGLYRMDLGCPPAGSGNQTIVVDHPNYQHREWLRSIPTASSVSEIVLVPR
ncbi:MAG TPA: carboxypeptidase regulatory-like domain-containing protein [Thermoanaerobaculia bacterium]|nr:carboxypeptidase regulatory-like domain-containing protein [Thermoanaerobaculia bacterium]